MIRRLVAASLAAMVVPACLPSADGPFDSTPETTTGDEDVPSPPSTTEPAGPTQIGDLLFTDVEVVDVPDGDSLLVRFDDGTQERVRLIGINAPESDECLGDEARDSLEAMVGDAVAIATERDDRDQFGRILAHVFVGHGYINRAQVERGLALAMSVEHQFFADLLDAQQLAADTKVGLWSESSCGGAPIESAIEITGVVTNPPGPDDDALDSELVELSNTGDHTVDLSGWVLRDESSANRFVFPDGFTLEPDQTVAVVSGCDPGAGQLGWCADRSIWNNEGDSVVLLDADGRIAAFERV